MTTQQSNNIKTIREQFMEWYLKKFNRRLPVYIRNDVKKRLIVEFEKETGIAYNN